MEQKAATAATETMSLIEAYVPSLVGAIILLVAGWFIAAWVARLAQRAIEKSRIGNRVAKAVAETDDEDAREVERWVGRGVFWILMLFVLVGFFQVLGISQVTEPITRFLNRIFEYLPRLIGPAVLILLAWLIGKFLRIIVKRGVTAAKLDEKVGKSTEGQRIPLADTLGDAVYWLTLLLFLPAILSALDLGGLLEPVRDVVQEFLGYLPNLFGAALILLVGWFVAGLLRRIVTNLLAAAGTDTLAERTGVEKALGDHKLSNLLGLIVYILIFIPVLAGALNALRIEAVTEPVSAMLNQILAAVPNVFAGALVLIIAYVVGKIVAGLASNLLENIGFDSVPQKIGLGTGAEEGQKRLSQIAGYLLLVAIMLFATIEALGLIGFDQFAVLVGDFLVFASRIVLGIVVIGLGVFVGKVVADLVKSANPPQANLLANIARVAIIVLSFAMGLEQMGVGEEIITLAFGLTLGAVAIAAAIAFGIGGRDAAAEVVTDLRDKLSKK